VGESAHYIVDGYNVLHASLNGLPGGDLGARRDWLVERLVGFAALKGAQVTVVFDVHGRRGVSCQQVKGTAVEVCFAGGHLAADALIARRIAEASADVLVYVVSADQEVQRTATRAGVHRLTPRELLAEIAAAPLANAEKAYTLRPQLEDKVDGETLRKLERLRTEEPDT